MVFFSTCFFMIFLWNPASGKVPLHGLSPTGRLLILGIRQLLPGPRSVPFCSGWAVAVGRTMYLGLEVGPSQRPDPPLVAGFSHDLYPEYCPAVTQRELGFSFPLLWWSILSCVHRVTEAPTLPQELQACSVRGTGKGAQVDPHTFSQQLLLLRWLSWVSCPTPCLSWKHLLRSVE